MREFIKVGVLETTTGTRPRPPASTASDGLLTFAGIG